ncbi:MAG: hypothetical protein K1X75_01235 [Leptospirales bacterium]|nr:hypothetical protein [Leptospirales bacterium]
METSAAIALSGGLALAGSLTATVVALLRDRQERLRHRLQLALERRRFQHEQRRWRIEFTRDRELALFQERLRSYPALLKSLGALGEQRSRRIAPARLRRLAGELNELGYGPAALAMLADTRRALFILRDRCRRNGRTPAEMEKLLKARTDLIELLRRDLNHSSLWRSARPLLDWNERALNSEVLLHSRTLTR